MQPGVAGYLISELVIPYTSILDPRVYNHVNPLPGFKQVRETPETGRRVESLTTGEAIWMKST
jgi:hypothetical protein